MKESTNSTENFIKDTPSPVLYALFSKYVQFSYRSHFHRVFVRNSELITKESSFLFLMNHYTWWDGLLPILLHSKLFPFLNPKGIMDEEQLQKHSFFRKFHVFSINRQNPRKAVESLRYGAEHLQQKGSCLFIYPQGAIFPNDSETMQFESGYQRIIKQVPSTCVVPIVTYVEQFYSKKPVLWIHIGDTFEKNTSLHDHEAYFKSQLQCIKQDAIAKKYEQYKNLFI